MISDLELKRIYENIDDLDDQYKKMLESIVSIKTYVDTLSVDNRSITTSVQNLAMSFGALKERTDSIISSLRMLSESKDSMLDSASRETASRFTDFRSLCDSRVSTMEYKIQSANKYTDSEIETLKSSVKVDLSALQATVASNKSAIEKIMAKAYWAAWATIVNLFALCMWLVKLLGVSYGWWT